MIIDVFDFLGFFGISYIRRIFRLIYRVGRRPLFLWRRIQYSIGLRQSRLVSLGSFPEAPYRAVVFGLEEGMWESFDAAYPEYEKIFAPVNVTLVELRAALAKRNIALLVFDNASKRHVDTVTTGLGVTVFFGSYAPIPRLQKGDSTAVGFLIDTVGDWLSAQRQTEVNFFLENFNLKERKAVLADGAVLKSRLLIAPATGSGCLIIANEADDNADIYDVASTVSAPSDHDLFKQHLFEPWYNPEVVKQFLERLNACDTVVVRDSPLGLLACFAGGRKVVVTGRPFWAGYGLTSDVLPLNRRRTLSSEALIALVMLVLPRYVDEAGKIIDPSQGWMLSQGDGADPSLARG